nr:PIN domain-containing protein [Anatilimnocola floriformis]
MELVQQARNSAEQRRPLQLVAAMNVVWPTEPECEQALDFFKQFHLSHNLGLIDSLIASLAVGRAATLFSFNAKHYQCVPGLIVKRPYVR